MRKCYEPHLGCATTRELLEEVAARIEVYAYEGENKKTVDRMLQEVASLRLEMTAYGPSLDHRTIDEV